MGEGHTAAMPTLLRRIPPVSSTRGSPPWGLVEAVGAATLLLAMLGSTLAGFEVARASAPPPTLAVHAPRAVNVVAAREAAIERPADAREKAAVDVPPDDIVTSKPRLARPPQHPRLPWMRH